jgi:hypothetical protein
MFGFRRRVETTVDAAYRKDTKTFQELPEIVPFLNLWITYATGLRIIQIFLGSVATIFSVLTATSVNDSGWGMYAKIFALIAAVSIGLMTAFDLGTKSNNMMNAWRQLNAAAIKFDSGLCEKKDVVNAYIEGEKLIGNVTFQQHTPQPGN